MDSRLGWGWLLIGVSGCSVDKTESSTVDSAPDTAVDTASGCNDGMTKEEWLAAWNLSFCTLAVKCEWAVYGESMERCYDVTASKADRCIDECRTADALAAMQAHEASGSCETPSSEAGVPYCTE